MNKALGLIETIGLVSAIEAADAAVKAADVVLLGYENTKGSGKITIKFAGGVGAVKAAVAAGVAAASRIGQVYGSAVIPRPHEEIDALIRNLDRGRGLAADKPVEAVAPPPPVEEPSPAAEAEPEETAVAEADLPATAPVEPLPPADEVDTETAVPEAPEPEHAEAVAEEVQQCAATTRSGEPCRLPAQPGSQYCFVHRKLAAEA